MFYKNLIIASVLLLTSFSIESFIIFNNHDVNNSAAENKSKQLIIQNEEDWVLEFIDGQWWWVLYGSDGAIIVKIPYDF